VETSRSGAFSGSALRLEVLDGGVGLVTFDLPGSRANTLGQAVIAEFAALARHLAERRDLRGLILRSGKPGMFIAGADLREMGSMRPDRELNCRAVQVGLDMIAALENLPYPTVAAIEGSCMGGGTEVALGLDFRLASLHPKTDIGLPEVKVGLIPGWGGTQRLTRVIGPALATELICAGETVKATRAREIGLVFDAVPGERLLEEARRLLEWATESGAWHEARKKKQQPVGLSEEQHSFLFAVARAQVMEKTKGQYPAPPAALEAIARGCNLPLADGLKVETEQFLNVAGGPVSRNLIAVFFMGQRLQKDPGVSNADVKPREVQRVGVLGAGLMGAGIAGAHIRRGIPVMMLDTEPKALEKGVAAITKSMQSRIDIGRMTPADMVTALAHLSTTGSLKSMTDRDVVIEAVVENEGVKTQVYRDLQPILPPGAVLASNTSTISITRMAGATGRPEQFAGMHFFNPVDRMQLVEVIRGERTSDETVVTLVALAKRLGKTPIVVRDCPGFLVNRILFPYLNESLVLLEEGASPRAIDKAATAFGMPMGPVTLNDLVGLDTSLYAGRVVNAAFADRAQPTRILDELVAAGRLGQKSGAGFYSYAKGSRGVDDPAFEAILKRCRTGPQRDVGPEEITERLFLPMLTEASRVLTEGIVRDPGDVDMGLILGIGFPAFRGGLLRWADSLGQQKVLEMLRRYEKLGPRFRPTEQMRRLAAEGKGFYPE
jgi:3-hydroxyacyl-CoA dehydrogenase/enoyl-CoA hydratase/3-hydroxybutyryl-CoA epimerase/3-hydroxyacyl-CoA dehydrogenase/enoyl-CoA hydratase/3-hydroxybutyryl-CoA epimerase/enoyl-CoA isomerase